MNNDTLAALNKAIQSLPLSEEEQVIFTEALKDNFGNELREYEIANCMEEMLKAGLRPTGRDGAATITGERYEVSPSTVLRFHAKYFHNPGNLTTDYVA